MLIKISSNYYKYKLLLLLLLSCETNYNTFEHVSSVNK